MFAPDSICKRIFGRPLRSSHSLDALCGERCVCPSRCVFATKGGRLSLSSMDQTASYCTALIAQERGLEELQRHLRTTEDLFRESVKRKNQQLDLLQSEVRRLKSSVNNRDELTAAHMEQALGAQGGELQTLRERLSRRDTELDSLNAKMAGLEAALQTEEQRSAEATERAAVAEAARARSTESQRGELEILQERLADTQRVSPSLTATPMVLPLTPTPHPYA